jgi:glycogen debranching enzyme
MPVGSLCQNKNQILQEEMSHAIFYDVTHDNKSLIRMHSVYDVLPTSSLVSMCGCATGSTRGFDELVPEEINVVTEKRPYAIWDETGLVNKSIGPGSGILKGIVILIC